MCGDPPPLPRTCSGTALHFYILQAPESRVNAAVIPVRTAAGCRVKPYISMMVECDAPKGAETSG